MILFVGFSSTIIKSEPKFLSTFKSKNVPMNFQFEKLTFRFFNLSAAFLLLLFFSQCVSKEDDILPTEDLTSELLEDINKLPAMEDPDPVIEDPDYGVLFAPNLSLEILEKIGTISAGEELAPSTLEILKAIGAHAKNIDPELVALIGNINAEFLLGLMDPEKPLDPRMEEFLQKMLKIENLNLSLPEVLEIKGLIDLEILKKPKYKVGTGTEQMRTVDLTNYCASEVYEQYGSGARACSSREQEDTERIEVNYIKRMNEAEQRFNQRNDLIMTLYSQKSLVKTTIMAQIMRTVDNVGNPEKVEEIKEQLKYVGLIYAYYVRIHLSTIYQGGLAINHLYFQNEVMQINDLRDQKMEETRINFRTCLDQVNILIVEETENRCPGEEPYTY